MKPISDTGQAALVEYRTVRYEYALAHPFCEAQGCMRCSWLEPNRERDRRSITS